MSRLLVTNGCSLTQGAELPDPTAQAWPTLLAKAIGADVVNIAEDGSSNRKIVRSTLARLDAIRAEHGVRADEVTILLAWTQTSRHEYYSVKEPSQGWLTGWRSRGPVEDNWRQIGPWSHVAGHKPSRAFYNYLWSEEGQLANFFLDWLLLDQFLLRRGYEPRYAFGFPVNWPIPEPAVGFARELRSESTWGGLPCRGGASFQEMPGELRRGIGGHPLAEGHEWFASQLGDWLAS